MHTATWFPPCILCILLLHIPIKDFAKSISHIALQPRSLKDKGVCNQKFILVHFTPLNKRKLVVCTAETDLTPLHCESINDKRNLAEDSKLDRSVQRYVRQKGPQWVQYRVTDRGGNSSFNFSALEYGPLMLPQLVCAAIPGRGQWLGWDLEKCTKNSYGARAAGWGGGRGKELNMYCIVQMIGRGKYA